MIVVCFNNMAPRLVEHGHDNRSFRESGRQPTENKVAPLYIFGSLPAKCERFQKRNTFLGEFASEIVQLWWTLEYQDGNLEIDTLSCWYTMCTGYAVSLASLVVWRCNSPVGWIRTREWPCDWTKLLQLVITDNGAPLQCLWRD